MSNWYKQAKQEELKNKLIRLGNEQPELRKHLRPVLDRISSGNLKKAVPKYIEWIIQSKDGHETALEVLDPKFVRRLKKELEVMARESGMKAPEVPERKIKETREFLQREVELIEQRDWEALNDFHEPGFKPHREIEFGFIKKGLNPFLKKRRDETPIPELKNLPSSDVTREFKKKFLKSSLASITNGLENWEKYGPEEETQEDDSPSVPSPVKKLLSSADRMRYLPDPTVKDRGDYYWIKWSAPSSVPVATYVSLKYFPDEKKWETRLPAPGSAQWYETSPKKIRRNLDELNGHWETVKG